MSHNNQEGGTGKKKGASELLFKATQKNTKEEFVNASLFRLDRTDYFSVARTLKSSFENWNLI